MKFLYEYRTTDNARHDGLVCASSRDAAFAELKRRGIKPARLVEAPGFFNKLFGKGKRWIAIGVLGVAVVVAVFVIRQNKQTIQTIELSQTSPLPRHQIYGDPALMEELERTDYAAVFPDPGLRYLARFAQPGAIVQRDLRKADEIAAMISKCVDVPVTFDERDSREVRELKQVILAMQSELKRYLSVGRGTPKKYVFRLNERQNRESQIYYTALHDLEKTSDSSRWEKINASLRAIGLKTIPKPPSDSKTAEESRSKIFENTGLTSGKKK